ncbi:MAG: hypothetical protein AAGE52_18205 [Myxococcota bacterium]
MDRGALHSGTTLWLKAPWLVVLWACDAPSAFVDASVDAGTDSAPPQVEVVLTPRAPSAAVHEVPEVDPCASCVAPSECETATCVDGECVVEPVLDTTPCGEVGWHCVRGICRARGCGDGYREPGPSPLREACDDANDAVGDACNACETTVATVASREDGYDTFLGAASVGVDDDGLGLVVWAAEDLRETEPRLQLRAYRMERGGAIVGEALVLHPSLPLGVEIAPKVAGAGEGWAVAWLEDGQAVVRRVLRDGSVSPRRLVGTGVRDVALARDGDVLAFVAQPDALTLHRFDEEFLRSDATTLRSGSIQQVAAASASHGPWAVTWSEGDARVRARVSGRGVFEIGAGGDPSMAATAAGFAIAWSTAEVDPRGDVWVREIGVEGLGDAIAIAERPVYAESQPSIAALGEGWVASWHERGAFGGGGLFLHGVSSPESEVLASLVAPPGDQGGLTLATGPDGAWVAWSAGPPTGVAHAIRSSFFTILSEASR